MFTTLSGDKFEKTNDVCGIGAYGTVATTRSAIPRLNLVAVKKLFTENMITGSSVSCEIDIANMVKDHPNCVKLIDIAIREESSLLSPRDPMHEDLKIDPIYPVFERSQMSLHQALFDNDFSFDQIRSLMFQMASSIHFMHSKGIMHRDIKSNNFLYFPNHTVKICDFGESKIFNASESSTPRMSHFMFRAPEIFLHLNYDFKVDVWSLGCLFIYMISKSYMFKELLDETDDDTILNGILRLLPYSIDTETYNKMIDKNMHFTLTSKSSALYRSSWSEILSSIDEHLITLINAMLQFNPDRRITMGEVLASSFFSSCTPIPFPIQKSRNFYYQVNSCLERAQFIVKVFPMDLRFQNNTWYNPRIIFFALDLFDQVLYSTSSPTNISNFAVSYFNDLLKSDGKIFTRKIISFLSYACLYFALKYFYMNKVQIEWKNFSKNKFTETAYLQFEQSLFFLTSYSFYRLNLYEVFSPLTDSRLKSLMRFLSNTTCNGKTFYQYRAEAQQEIFSE